MFPSAVTFFTIVFLQYVSAASECKHGECAYGEEIADFGCRRTNQKCGENMRFSSSNEICWLRCECKNEKYIGKDDKCIEIHQQTIARNNPTTIGFEKSSTISSHNINSASNNVNFASNGASSYDKSVCLMMQGRKCGIHMIFREIQPSNSSESFSSNDKICWLRCRCENESYTREGEKCVEIQQRTAIANNPTAVGEIPIHSHSINNERNYKVGDQIFDFGCRRTNQKCGTNMIFKTISKVLLLEYPQPSYRCFQKCSCISEKYIENDGECREGRHKTEID
ncbi:unnamed protein product [Dracunculus medinensis]|uniref:TIL domain-containing protein n=1 Tax=Dracunculus medinensis TaxID=318479 RepID=A0A0N4UQE7_DRAME|nr:unnamed protein product [Dracunculus medinensis]